MNLPCKPTILLLILIIGTFGHQAMSQKELNTWYFGFDAGLDFNTSPPTALSCVMRADEGCSAISDKDGSILFFSDGITVYDRTLDTMMEHIDLLGGFSSTQAALIIAQPETPDRFYLFTTENDNSPGRLAYSVVDMNLNGGLGDIIDSTKNTILVDSVGEKVTSAIHANGTDVWIVTHSKRSNEFLAFLLTADGLDTTPVISAIGSVYLPHHSGARGAIRISHNAAKVACAGQGLEVIELFDFNWESGVVSDFINLAPILPDGSRVYHMEFSPDNQFLYLSGTLGLMNFVYQIEIETLDVTLINSNTDAAYAWGLQLAPDGAIYVARSNYNFVDVIYEPNQKGMACQYVREAIQLAPLARSRRAMTSLAPYALYPDSLPVPNIGQDFTLCPGDTVYVRASFPKNCFAVSYHWSDGSTNSTLAVFQPGLYYLEVLTTCGTYRDTVLAGAAACDPIAHYDLDVCRSYMSDGSHMEYDEFIATYPVVPSCSSVAADHLMRLSAAKHSCTPGVNGSVAMCIGAADQESYTEGHPLALQARIQLQPHTDSALQLTKLTFFERAPIMYNWIDGPSGPNNYPTKYGVRILKNGNEIWRQSEIPTEANWHQVQFRFNNDTSFFISSPADIHIEWLAYDPAGVVSTVSAWDIDEIALYGHCQTDTATIVEGSIMTSAGHAIPGVQVTATDVVRDIDHITYTNERGAYRFKNIPRGSAVVLRCGKPGDAAHGVSVYDLVQLQKQLLFGNHFNTLVQYVAADVNRSQSLSVLDLLATRKVILGATGHFPGNFTWRFGPADQNLTSGKVSSFAESKEIEVLTDRVTRVDFIGIKTGDIDASHVPNQ